MVVKTQWLKFIEKKPKPKTRVFAVTPKENNCELGEIKWYGPWRHYCFFPTTEIETVHSDRCLLEISTFITRLNKEHADTKEGGR